MDINDIRAVFTLLTFVAFIGVWVWAWSSRRRGDFDQTARQLFSETEERIHNQSKVEVSDE